MSGDNIDQHFFFQVAVLPFGLFLLSRFRANLFCKLTLLLLPLAFSRLFLHLTCCLWSSGKPGEGAGVAVGVGIVGNGGGNALPAETLAGVGWCGLLVERVGIECAPWGGPAAGIPAEGYKNASWTVVCYYSVHHGEQMAPRELEPLASMSRSSAGGETLEESPPKLMSADD